MYSKISPSNSTINYLSKDNTFLTLHCYLKIFIDIPSLGNNG